MKVLIINGHPSQTSLTKHLLSVYRDAIPQDILVDTLAVRDLRFDPVLHNGYSKSQPWEPDLIRAAELLIDCDHLAIGFPLWWGAEPPALKGLMDRLLLPDFAFTYDAANNICGKLLGGRSADLFITMETPPLYMRTVLGDNVVSRYQQQIFAFCGIRPVRAIRFGPTRNTAANLPHWQSRLEKAATSITGLPRGKKGNVTSSGLILAGLTLPPLAI